MAPRQAIAGDTNKHSDRYRNVPDKILRIIFPRRMLGILIPKKFKK
jgi:hypothetical protein